MKAYEVILKCVEEDDPASDCGLVKLLTTASSISEAEAYAVKAYSKADETTEGFHWEAVTITQLDANLCLPATKEIKPKVR
jgi:hypothetical protein